MLTILGMVARFSVLVGAAFILGKTVASMSNKAFRFVTLFVLCVPLNFVINYVNVRAFGYHKMGWNGAFIIALIFATWGTFLGPQPHDSNTT
jgi:hypothetical protein